MRKLFLLILFVPQVIFCEESESFKIDLFNNMSFFHEGIISSNLILLSDIPFFDEKTEKPKKTVSQKIFNSVIDIGIPLLWAGLSYGLREGTYKNDYSKNWFGTVNGVFTLSFCGALSGMFIPLLIDLFFAKGELSPFVYLIGMFTGMIAGVVLAFVPPSYYEFRENPVAYYSAPGLVGIIGTISVITIWIK
jgi:hypothetical protein